MATTTVKGQRAEQLAVQHLIDRGYRILERNYRCKGGEIDVVAEQGRTLCFVEVRSRRDATLGDPLETIGGRKQARVIAAARHYLARHRCEGREVRFDAVGIVYRPQLTVQLVQGAFEAGWY